ncbi:MAG: NUDIX domain-containing protein [Candidatus Aenigmarchaeota archaeon]|nr:NUDIX domain-containing protein [Candidatus Aenigmarchaeota archaeon]
MTEYFDVVDDNDKVIGKATREECHSSPRFRHRGVHVVIYNSKDQVLLQKRSMNKDLYPGVWIEAASGHVESGDTYENTAKRELKEELGVETKLKKISKIVFNGEKEREFIMIFMGKHDGPFKIEEDDIEEVKFFGVEEIKRMMKEYPEDFCIATPLIFKEYLKFRNMEKERHKVDDEKEMFDVIDENDSVIGKMTRGEAHGGSMKLHRKIHVLVFNSKGEVFIQRRSMTRKQNPGQWTSSAAGHVNSRETYEVAARRECKEELGVDIEPSLVTKYPFQARDEKEIISVLEAKHNGPFTIHPEEADKSMFIRVKDLVEKSEKGEMKLTEHFARSLKEYLKAKGG